MVCLEVTTASLELHTASTLTDEVYTQSGICKEIQWDVRQKKSENVCSFQGFQNTHNIIIVLFIFYQYINIHRLTGGGGGLAQIFFFIDMAVTIKIKLEAKQQSSSEEMLANNHFPTEKNSGKSNFPRRNGWEKLINHTSASLVLVIFSSQFRKRKHKRMAWSSKSQQNVKKGK